MPGHFVRFSASARSSGVILLREATPISTVIEEIVLIWSASEADDEGLAASSGFHFDKNTSCDAGKRLNRHPTREGQTPPPCVLDKLKGA
jgi:hypothetical protein